MILIADSGSTKTDWCLSDAGQVVARVATQGINPFFQSDETIGAILRDELLPLLLAVEEMDVADFVSKVCFYGAGIRPEMRSRMQQVIGAVFGAADVEAESDLLGAARALFGDNEGIACILGTGANSGLYDGRQIVMNTPPLGFILGDEGSGAVMGKLFLGSLCKGLMPEGMLEDYLAATGQTLASIIQSVYREPLPNRFLAQTSRYIHAHLHVDEVRELVVDNFRAFFRRNLTQYARRDLEVGFIGSVAFHYASLLKEAARVEGYRIGAIMPSPMEGLLAFHDRGQ